MIDFNNLSEEDYECARLAVEDALVDFRDNRRFTLRNNGLVIKERDGTPSSIIRLPIEVALRIGMQAIIERQRKGNGQL